MFVTKVDKLWIGSFSLEPCLYAWFFFCVFSVLEILQIYRAFFPSSLSSHTKQES